MATRNIVPRATGEGGIGTAAKKWALGWINALIVVTINALTLTANAIGFSISGGTTSKTLTVTADTSLDEAVAMSSKVTAEVVSAKSFAANGYQKFYSGLIVQWGSTQSINGGASADVTLPIAFSNSTFKVFLIANLNSGADAKGFGSTYNANFGVQTFTVNNHSASAISFKYLAIGY